MDALDTVSLGEADLAVIDAALEGALRRRDRMAAANGLIERWGPVKAVPELYKIGLRREQVEAITRPGESCGFTALDLARLDRSIERLRAFRRQVAAGDAQAIPVEEGTANGEVRSFAAGHARPGRA